MLSLFKFCFWGKFVRCGDFLITQYILRQPPLTVFFDLVFYKTFIKKDIDFGFYMNI